MAIVGTDRIRLKDGTEILVRSARESDARALLEAVRIVFSDGEGMIIHPDEFSKTEEEEVAWIKSLNDNPRELLVVAEFGNDIIGTIAFHIGKIRRLSHSGHFGMCVRPDWRNRGVGNVLLDTLLRWASSTTEIEKIRLNVRADNDRAIALYNKHGFVQCGCSRKAIKLTNGVYVDDLTMERFLNS